MASESTVTTVVKLLTTLLGIEDRAASIDESTALFGSLPELDSMGVVELISALETEFGFEVDDAEITGEVFETVGTLADFVDSKVAVGGEGAPAP
ncbi:MAG TPA: acyl carrier protein [Acidimicrobiia bacterium]|nr:acyl carrier protein [Acidimicrobiia bacterium]